MAGLGLARGSTTKWFHKPAVGVSVNSGSKNVDSGSFFQFQASPMKTIRALIFFVTFLAAGMERGSAASGNEAIVRYLGDPVPAPANLSPKHTGDGIAAAFRELCDRAGVKIERLEVDNAEFPFIVFGRLQGGREFMARIDSHLKTMPGYAYAGSVVGMVSTGETYFSLTMTPASEYPRESAAMIRRRLMVRLSMLADEAK